MLRYTLKTKPNKSVKVFGRGMRISTKSSITVCNTITGMTLNKGKKMLEDLIAQKRSLKGKYYTNTVESILDLLQLAVNNAEFKALDTDKLFIHASAHTAPRFFRPRRQKMRRQKIKNTHIQLFLEQK